MKNKGDCTLISSQTSGISDDSVRIPAMLINDEDDYVVENDDVPAHSHDDWELACVAQSERLS
ncbi:hypothetical protein [Vibrio fluvialis]|uniref:hypothetical protein n=1 Tax=Vibrio fluvialis TaxID=676 RepID=UPI00096B702D|nr:hypothetical protein [Vibrio fluvialis]